MIAERYTDYMYRLLEKVLDEIGPRESCSEEEKRLGRLFASEIDPVCERIDRETFTCSPNAAFGVFPYFVLAYVISVVFYYVYPPVSVVLMAIVIAVFFLEIVNMRELIDYLFTRKEGENVAGIVSPRGEVRKRVIFSGHFDSAFEFKLWYWFKNFSIPIMIAAIFAFFLLFGASLARAIQNTRGFPGGGIYTVLGIICISLLPLVALFLVFHTRDLVPGAMDDLAGVCVVAGLGKYLEEARDGEGFYPESTEVVLLGMSSEEAGLRGAKRYAARHENEMKAIPTHGIFFDGICDERHLTVIKKETGPGAKHDPYLIKLARDTAKENDFDVKTWTTPPVGASDAAAFSNRGVSSVALFCIETSKLPPNYHTRLDTAENVRPASLAVCLQMAIDMLRSIDET